MGNTGNAMLSNILFQLRGKLTKNGTSVKVTDDIKEQQVIVSTGASVVMKSLDGKKIERMVGDFAGGVFTITQRGLNRSQNKVTDPNLLEEWAVGSLGYITVLASDIMDLDEFGETQEPYTSFRWYGENDWYYDARFWKSQRAPRFATEVDADTATPIPEDGQSRYVDALGYFQDRVSGSWQPRAAGTTPNGDDNTSGKWQGATPIQQGAHDDIGSTGAHLVLQSKNTAKSRYIYYPAYLTGGSTAEGNFAAWTAVNDGRFQIAIDYVLVQVSGLDFSAVTSMADVAAIIQAGIRAQTGNLETVVWSTDHFVTTSADTTLAGSDVWYYDTYAGVGTDISGAGASTWMAGTLAKGAVRTGPVVNGGATENLVAILGPNGMFDENFYLRPNYGSTVADKFATYYAGEAIAANQHLVLSGVSLQQLVVASVLNTPPGTGASYSLNAGQAFTSTISNTIKTITVKITAQSDQNVLTSWSLNAKIYAVTGTPGSTGVPTGAALFTSATVTGSKNVFGGPSTLTLTFTFAAGAAVPAGNFAISIEGTASVPSGHVFGFNVQSSGASVVASGNGYANGVAAATKDMYYDITQGGYAIIGDASNTSKLAYIGKAVAAAALNANVNTQIRGTLTETGAAADDALWYLSNTPGTISLTPGTNIVVVAKGFDTNKVSLRGLADNSGTIYSSIIASQIFYLAGGGIFNFDALIVNPDASTNTVTVQVSDDRVNWSTIGSSISTSAQNADRIGSFNIPSNQFVRMVFASTGGGSLTLNKVRVVPF